MPTPGQDGQKGRTPSHLRKEAFRHREATLAFSRNLGEDWPVRRSSSVGGRAFSTSC